MADPTSFVDTNAVIARGAEVPLADFGNGCNNAGSCAHGIGINIDGGPVVGTPDQFTLLDQHGNARAAQISQSIGGYPYVANAAYPSSGGTEGTAPDSVIRTGTLPTQAAKDADPALDGTIIPVGNATLIDLNAGWVAA